MTSKSCLSPSFTLLSSMVLLLSHRPEAAQPSNGSFPFYVDLVGYVKKSDQHGRRAAIPPPKVALAPPREETD